MIENTYLRALLVGKIAGMRSLSAPACTALSMLYSSIPQRNFPLQQFLKKRSAFLIVAASGEMVADKLPFIPSRIRLLPILARIISGTSCGYILCKAGRRQGSTGALLGGISALISAFTFYFLRQYASRKTKLPDGLFGLLEDCIVGSICVLLNK